MKQFFIPYPINNWIGISVLITMAIISGLVSYKWGKEKYPSVYQVSFALMKFFIILTVGALLGLTNISNPWFCGIIIYLTILLYSSADGASALIILPLYAVKLGVALFGAYWVLWALIHFYTWLYHLFF